MWSSFLNIGITFTVFKVEGKVPIKKDIVAIRDIGSLSGVLKRFKNLRGMLHGPIDSLFSSLAISQRTSPALVSFIKKEYSFGLFRYLEKFNFDFTRLSSIFSAIEVKWLLKLFAFLVGFSIVLLPTWMQLISLLSLVVMLIIFLMPS